MQTMVTSLVKWICVVCLATCGTRAQGECGPNVVQMFTRNTPPCRLRFDTTLVDANSPTTTSAIASGRAAGDAKYQQELQREQTIVKADVTLVRRTSEYEHYMSLKPAPGAVATFQRTLRYKNQAMEIGKAVTKAYGLNNNLSGDVLIHLNISLAEACSPDPRCNATDPYRSYDGSCTNLKDPRQGMAREAFTRLLLPLYDDGIYTPRRSVDGSELPNPRKLRTLLIPDRDVPDNWNTLAVMQWGQLVSHEIAQSPDQYRADGLGVMCCTQDGEHLNTSLVSQGCYPVDLSDDDSFYYMYGRRCMSIGRSNVTFALDCRLGAAEQTNLRNTVIDASVVYGVDKATADSFRTFRGGQLKVQLRNGRAFLPQSNDPEQDCDRLSGEDTCFSTDDIRANQNLQLSVLHVVLLREHNRLVTVLARINPRWDDYRLYQEGRKIVGAMFQHITYKDMVPIYLGRDYSHKLDLPPLKSGYRNGYSDKIALNIINSFTAASYRAFHSLVQGSIRLMDNNRCPVKDILFSSNMFQPNVLMEKNNFDQLLLGLVTQPSQSADEFYTSEITNKLFRIDNPFGQDLALFDIVRSRDHGLPPYNDFRALCGLPRAMHWEDFTDWISEANVRAMKSLYRHQDDVDLFVGGILERPLKGALLGPTFQCITGEQFYRLKFGDRFFYEFQNPYHGFKPEQLQEIRKATLSRLVCDHGDNITTMQRHSFRKVSPQNPLVPCNDTVAIPKMDLNKWKE